jgi:hypothetical protein
MIMMDDDSGLVVPDRSDSVMPAPDNMIQVFTIL